MNVYKDRSDEGLWTASQVADYLRISKKTLYNWQINPLCKFPEPVRAHPTSRPLYFRIEDIEEFKKSGWMSDE